MMNFLVFTLIVVVSAFVYVFTLLGVLIATAVGGFFASAICSRYSYWPIATLLGAPIAYAITQFPWHSTASVPTAMPRLWAIVLAALLGFLLSLLIRGIEPAFPTLGTLNPLPALARLNLLHLLPTPTALTDIRDQPRETVAYRKQPATPAAAEKEEK